MGYHAESAVDRTEFMSIAAGLSETGYQYDEFWVLAHSGSGSMAMSATGAGAKVSADDVAQFISLAGLRNHSNILLGCNTDNDNLLGRTAHKTGLPTYGTQEDLVSEVLVPQWLRSDRSRFELSIDSLVRWRP